MKKKLTVLLSVALTLVSAAACGDSSTKQTEGKPDEIKGVYTLYDYEDYSENFELLRMSENFGILSKNNEVAYVKSGSSSLKIQPSGSSLKNTKPHFVVPTVSERYNYNYSNFNEIYSVKCSVYNAEEYEVSVSMGMSLSMDHQTLSAYYETFTLQSGWNELEYVIWDGAQLKNVSGIYFRFDNYAFGGKTSPVLYMDDFTLVQKDDIVRYIELIDIAEGEICTIHDFTSLQYFSIAGYGTTYQPEWVSETELETFSGEYTGKAVRFSMPIFMFSLQVKPRISREIFCDYIAEGYTKISFWVAVEAANGKPVKLTADNGLYSGATMAIEDRTWTKITVDITEDNIESVYNQGYIRLTGIYMSAADRYGDDGNTTTVFAYVGDVALEK